MVTCVSCLAAAGEKEQAKRLFGARMKLMRMDDFAKATANFERSVALYPTQNGLFNLANSWQPRHRSLFSLIEATRAQSTPALLYRPLAST